MANLVLLIKSTEKFDWLQKCCPLYYIELPHKCLL